MFSFFQIHGGYTFLACLLSCEGALLFGVFRDNRPACALPVTAALMSHLFRCLSYHWRGRKSPSACWKAAPNAFPAPSKPAALPASGRSPLAAGGMELWRCLCPSSPHLSHPHVTFSLAEALAAGWGRACQPCPCGSCSLIAGNFSKIQKFK